MCRQSNGLPIYRKRAASHRYTVDHHHLLGHLSRTAGQPAVDPYYQFLYGDGRLDYCPSGNLFSNYFIDRSAQKNPEIQKKYFITDDLRRDHRFAFRLLHLGGSSTFPRNLSVFTLLFSRNSRRYDACVWERRLLSTFNTRIKKITNPDHPAMAE